MIWFDLKINMFISRLRFVYGYRFFDSSGSIWIHSPLTFFLLNGSYWINEYYDYKILLKIFFKYSQCITTRSRSANQQTSAVGKIHPSPDHPRSRDKNL